MKKSKLLMLSALALGALARCTEKGSTPASSEEVAESSSSESIEEANPLEMALEAAQAEKLALTGKLTHTYHYENVMVAERDVTRKSTITTSFEKDAWNLSTLDDGIGNKTYYTTYFKDEDGFLSSEYLEADNTIGIVPVLTYGTKELFDAKYQNPFQLLNVADFTKDGDKYTLTGAKAQMFVAHTLNESYAGGSITFTITEGAFSAISATDFKVNDYLYTSSDAYARETTVSFELAIGTKTSIHHLSVQNDKGYSDLETALKAAEGGKFHIKNGSSATDMGFEAYFDGTNIFATFNVGGTSAEDFDMYLTPADDGKLDLYMYDGSKWITGEEYSEGEMYIERFSYDDLAPKMHEVSSNIFSKSKYSSTYSVLTDGLQYIGEYFVSYIYDALNLSSMESLRHNVSSLQLSNVSTTGFDIAIASVINGSGYQTKSNAYLQISEIGTCTLPFAISIGE